MTRIEKIAVALLFLTIGILALTPASPNRDIPYTEEIIIAFPSSKLMYALRVIESSQRADAVSNRGAQGLYQIMPLTWQDHSSRPFSDAFDPVESEAVAIRYLQWIRTTLNEWMGKTPTLEEILSCWHGGIGRFRQKGYSPEKMPNSTREFVNRVMGMMK